MSKKLTRDEILREMLTTLINGWGRKSVFDALNEIAGVDKAEDVANMQPGGTASNELNAVRLVTELQITNGRKVLMLQLAKDYEAGSAFPKISDVKAFLASHNHRTNELRSRDQSFRMIIPILQKMSEKGLLVLLSRSRHSGPADLGSISDAIKSVGQNLGAQKKDNEIK